MLVFLLILLLLVIDVIACMPLGFYDHFNFSFYVFKMISYLVFFVILGQYLIHVPAGAG